LGDPDTLWHIVVGRWIIAHGAVPDHGIFSGTMANAPWVDQEWLGQIVMAWGYDHFGWAALVVGTALCEAAAIAILLRVLLNWLPPLYAMFAAVLSAALWTPHILARPYILTIPILVVWVVELVRARSENRAPSLWWVLLITLWANLHGSFLFGIGIAALLAAEAVLLATGWRGRVAAVRDWGCFGALAVGAALITPLHFNGLLFPFHLMNMQAMAYIMEWQGINFSSGAIWEIPIALWILIVLFAALTFGWRLPPTRVGMVVLLLAMALKHARYMDFLGVVSSLLLAPSLALQFNRERAPMTKIDRLMDKLARPADWRWIGLAGAIMIAVGSVILRVENIKPPAEKTPAAAIAEVESHQINGLVFNAYQFGGYLVFLGIPPFIDGRAELYGDDFITRYVEAVLMKNDSLAQLLDGYDIEWTLFPPNSPVAIFMDHLSGWRRLYTDSAAVVHVRNRV
ncbi:MAG: hypothetical protein JO189_03020, partial [Deltaproteobacteria bacterium]|nr:hypothetical protein [Deltaproteobacteria bacterium]